MGVGIRGGESGVRVRGPGQTVQTPTRDPNAWSLPLKVLNYFELLVRHGVQIYRPGERFSGNQLPRQMYLDGVAFCDGKNDQAFYIDITWSGDRGPLLASADIGVGE